MVYLPKFVKLIEQLAQLEITQINEIFSKEGIVNHNKYFEESLKKLKEELIERSLIAIEKIYRKMYTNLKTLDCYMSKHVRTVMADRFGIDSTFHKMSKNIVKISYEEKKSLINSQTKSLIEKNKNILDFDFNYLLDIIKNNYNSNDKYYQLIALLLCSGCRPYELISIAKFEKVNDNYVIQHGIAKSKQLESLVKPIVGITSDEFINCVNIVRKQFENIKETTAKYHGNIVIKKLFNNDNVTQSTMRSTYPQLSYHFFQDDRRVFKESMTITLWTNRVLGHAPEVLKTTAHYNTVNIRGMNPQIYEHNTQEKVVEEVVKKEKTTNEILEDLYHSGGPLTQVGFQNLVLKNGIKLPRAKLRSIYNELKNK